MVGSLRLFTVTGMLWQFGNVVVSLGAVRGSGRHDMLRASSTNSTHLVLGLGAVRGTDATKSFISLAQASLAFRGLSDSAVDHIHEPI